MDPAQAPLHGTLTALVTPFNRDGSLDLAALDALVDQQISAGIQGLVPCGTTGEAATLTAAERDQIVTRVVKRAAGRIAVVVGTGTNNTLTTIDNQQRAKALGADYGLVVTPYYNKPSSEGLYRHYAAVAQAVELPMIVYNVPSRTACDLKPELMLRLRSLPTIMGIKEATGELARVVTLRHGNANWALLSGDDATACAFVLMGGDGVISVVSNFAATQMVTMIDAARQGDLNQARALHHQLSGLMTAFFCEANPIPVKAAMAMQNRIQEIYRLPLCEMQPSHRAALHEVLRDGGWL